MQSGDGDEPELEHVGKDEERPASATELEDDLADHAVREEPDGDTALEASPAERDSQEYEHVGEGAELVEALVVLDAPDRVHQEQVGEVRQDREESPGERPAQR